MGSSTDGQTWKDLTAEVYAEVEECFPAAKAKKTRTLPGGKVVNMDREAMMARLHGVGAAISNKLSGNG